MRHMVIAAGKTGVFAWLLGSLAAGAALGGCGGGDGAGGSCVVGAACGGEIAAGRYKVTSFCAHLSEPLKVPDCDVGITVDYSGTSFTGHITFNADRTYNSELTPTGTFVEVFPAQCLNRNGVQTSCMQLNAGLQEAIDEDSSFSSVSCTGGSSCTCAFTFRERLQIGSGSYSTAGTTITLSSGGITGREPVPYCASGNQLTMTSVMMGMPGSAFMGTATSVLVLTKE